jgi:hypothetical protein
MDHSLFESVKTKSSPGSPQLRAGREESFTPWMSNWEQVGDGALHTTVGDPRTSSSAVCDSSRRSTAWTTRSGNSARGHGLRLTDTARDQLLSVHELVEEFFI